MESILEQGCVFESGAKTGADRLVGKEKNGGKNLTKGKKGRKVVNSFFRRDPGRTSDSKDEGDMYGSQKAGRRLSEDGGEAGSISKDSNGKEGGSNLWV